MCLSNQEQIVVGQFVICGGFVAPEASVLDCPASSVGDRGPLVAGRGIVVCSADFVVWRKNLSASGQ
jgi:hypothetical protein